MKQSAKKVMTIISYTFSRSETSVVRQSAVLTKEEQKKEKFDALPEWKKKLILLKQSKST